MAGSHLEAPPNYLIRIFLSITFPKGRCIDTLVRGIYDSTLCLGLKQNNTNYCHEITKTRKTHQDLGFLFVFLLLLKISGRMGLKIYILLGNLQQSFFSFLPIAAPLHEYIRPYKQTLNSFSCLSPIYRVVM